MFYTGKEIDWKETLIIIRTLIDQKIKHVYVAMYRLELRKGSHRMAWEGTPHSIQTGIPSIIGTGDCLTFSSHTAALFTDNGNLAINVTVSPCPC